MTLIISALSSFGCIGNNTVLLVLILAYAFLVYEAHIIFTSVVTASTSSSLVNLMNCLG